MLRLTILFFLFCATNATANSQASWKFEVLLDGKKIGYHDFLVKNQQGKQVVETEAEFDVKLLFVNLFSYQHQNTEIWRGNCLISIDAITDANGKDFAVRGAARGSGFELLSNAPAKTLPPCVMTFAYWNPEFLSQDRLLNSQTGEYESVTITQQDVETLTVQGRNIDAVKYLVDTKAGPLTLWYTQDDYRWLALESQVKGGRILSYKAVSLPDKSLRSDQPSG